MSEAQVEQEPENSSELGPQRTEQSIHHDQQHTTEIVEGEEGHLLELTDNDTLADDEMYEEIVGEVAQGENGEFYLVTDNNAPDVDIEGVSKIQVVVNENGTETVIFQNDGAAEVQPDAQKMNNDPYENDFDMVEEHPDMYMMNQMDSYNKGRRNRVYGQARCPECGQTFINTARLERHLSVHQIFGAFLCQLCGKTYKYEYNLFYHWRKTCRDLLELLPDETRKSMDVNTLREVVENVASKKADVGSIEFGISSQPLLRNLGLNPPMEARAHMYGKRGVMCKGCGVTVLAAHLPRHFAAHRGQVDVEEPSVGGGHFCDLCGLIFRHRDNLFKHWRANCPEIQANLPDDNDIQMDDQDLKAMVVDILKKFFVHGADQAQSNDLHLDPPPIQKTEDRARVLDSLTADLNVDLSGNPLTEEAEILEEEENQDSKSNLFDQKWIEDHGIVFADDLNDTQMRSQRLFSSLTQPKWSINGDMVQCPECFKTFMNIGRLERHMAGYHASNGSHHCVLCGNRFKYDYNLLYHYRRSCGYTKAFIDRDVREQIDSTSLRKLVRNLAQRQPMLPPAVSEQNTQLQTDSLIHKEMLAGLMVNSENVENQEPDGSGAKPPVTRIAPHNFQPQRTGLPHGYKCPHCQVVFYGRTAISLHMRMRHNEEFVDKDAAEAENQNDLNKDEDSDRPGLRRSARRPAQRAKPEEIVEEVISDPTPPTQPEQPPQLEPEPESEPPPVPAVPGRVLDGQGNDITKTEMVQEMIASGQLHVNDGEDVILVMEEEGQNIDYYERYEEMGPSTSQSLPVQQYPTSSRVTRSSRRYQQYDHEEVVSQEGQEYHHSVHVTQEDQQQAGYEIRTMQVEEEEEEWHSPSILGRRGESGGRKRKAVQSASPSKQQRLDPAAYSPSESPRRSLRQRTVSRSKLPGE
ncbi:unnamed protein product [Bursaphelenchus xylophilus]|uniref:(pine wood nematode) hypothetical protein n=1 Tax=Bursaphelenchus xylophilus TaxID=6326 RepID=A0A1I7RK59_BURXY|nr:unnamed protein product [Bursaphelenchus xylophilus]CAG9131483.1 unnamed protein product [Bursaphelenchus xylophilus]